MRLIRELSARSNELIRKKAFLLIALEPVLVYPNSRREWVHLPQFLKKKLLRRVTVIESIPRER